MVILKIKLTDFRNFHTKLIELSPKVTVIVGPNAVGKTNILESIYLLATGKSFKAKVEEEMINLKKDIARVKSRIQHNGENMDLEIVLTRGYIDIGKATPEKVARKRLTINAVGKRLIDFAGKLKVTLFGPWDMDLITESPSGRRRFLDDVLSQVDREYIRSLLSYEKGLRQRNRLLFRIREEGISRSQLLFWDKLLIKNGNYITQKREELINYMNDHPELDSQVFNIDYDKSTISEERLLEYKEEEIAAGTTLVGPHRDDLIFSIADKRDLAKYGSRGEQRMAILWAKLNELNYVEQVVGERPVLLLDDIFSELDHKHRKIVMEYSNKQQTIITTADEHFVEDFKKVEKIILNK
jgi:DNA replication and repair protein RecF